MNMTIPQLEEKAIDYRKKVLSLANVVGPTPSALINLSHFSISTEFCLASAIHWSPQRGKSG